MITALEPTKGSTETYRNRDLQQQLERRHRLVIQNMSYVEALATSALKKPLFFRCTKDDLCAVGYLSLVYAARGFQSDGAKFTTYTYKWIIGAFHDYACKLNRGGIEFYDVTKIPTYDQQSRYRELPEPHEVSAQCSELIACLDPREERVIRLHYNDGYSITEIARLLSLSRYTVFRIHRDALAKMRRKAQR